MDIVEKIFHAGVVGAGGAGFPTHVKLSVSNIDFLLVNGAECEPLLQVDKYLMREKSREVIEALDYIDKAVGVGEIYIALKGKYKKEIAALERIIEEAGSRVKIYRMETYYPAGDEQQIVYEITGRSVPEGGIPLDVSTVVTNVGTLCNIHDAVTKDKPVTRKYLSIHGEVENQGIIDVPIGMAIEECLKEAGIKPENYCVVVGGPMMGRFLRREEVAGHVVTKTTGALIVLPEDHYLLNRNKKRVEQIIKEARSTCIQCRMCTDLCPRYLIGQSLRPHRIMRSAAMMEPHGEILKEALYCCECGVCELFACPMGLSPRMVNIYIKDILRKNGVRVEKRKDPLRGNPMREYRKIPTHRLIARTGLKRYDHFPEVEAVRLESTKVSIPLRQHIGVAASVVVAVGDHVREGDLIGRCEGGLGANIHASIDGQVTCLGDSVTIERKGGCS